MITYKQSGVDISKANSLVDFIKQEARTTLNENVISGIGGFASSFGIPSKYKNPIVVCCTDGVGTKIRLAKKYKIYSTIGIDLVAMCVNDLITNGAEPIMFLDYYATGKLEKYIAKLIMSGIIEGCEKASCELSGGEIAEMPGVYPNELFDLAGFAIGVVEKNKIINGERIFPGDVLIGLKSSGLHSNGYSLVNKILDKYPEKENDRINGELLEVSLLTPTIIYVDIVKQLLNEFTHNVIKGMAHITGGGLKENIIRMGEGLEVELNTIATYPPIFKWIQNNAQLSNEQMESTFNCGYGFVICVDKAFEFDVSLFLEKHLFLFDKLGKVVKRG